MWTPRRVLVACTALVCLQSVSADVVCPDGQFSVSVLDESVQCVAGTPCSGTYSASGLIQGVGSCPSGTGCALLPNTVIMGCVGAGRSDITYVNADGTLTKDGKAVSIDSSTAKSAASGTSTASSNSKASTASSNSKASTASSSSTASTASSSSTASTSSGSTPSTSSSSSNSATQTQTTDSSTTSPGTVEASDTSAMDDSVVKTNSTASSNSTSSSGSSSTSASLGSLSSSSSGSADVSDPSTTANAKTSWDGSKINDASAESNSSSVSGGTSIGTIIAIVVGCLAVVAVAAGARLLQQKKDPEMTTPAAAGEVGGDLDGDLESYGGTGMTPKENVLLL